MAQVRARPPYRSDRPRGRANDAHAVEARTASNPDEPKTPTVETVELPPADDNEKVHEGTGVVGEGIEGTPDGTEHELTATEVEADNQADAARAEPQPEPQPEPQSEPVSTENYATWTVTQLVAELKRRELTSSGAKPDLVARLRAHDRGGAA